MPPGGKGPRLIKRKGKPNFFIRFMDEKTGKQKETTTGTAERILAEDALESFLALRRAARTGQAVHPSKITIAEILDDYARYIGTDKESARLGYSIVNLLKFWQTATGDQYNKEKIKEYQDASPRAPGTIRRELTSLRAAINHAISMERMQLIPEVKLPKGGKPKDRWLERDEMARLLWAASQEPRSKFALRLFIIIALYTGARRAAIMELEWSQINFKTGIIDFNKIDQIVSNKRRARIPMPKNLAQHLERRYKFSQNCSPYVFHSKQKPFKKVGSIVKGFRAACVRANLKDVTPHTLRHTRVSWLVQSGEKISDVAEYVPRQIQ